MKAFVGTASHLAEAFTRSLHEHLNKQLRENGAPGHLIDAWDDVPEDVRKMAVEASADTLRSFAMIPSAMLQTNN